MNHHVEGSCCVERRPRRFSIGRRKEKVDEKESACPVRPIEETKQAPSKEENMGKIDMPMISADDSLFETDINGLPNFEHPCSPMKALKERSSSGTVGADEDERTKSNDIPSSIAIISPIKRPSNENSQTGFADWNGSISLDDLDCLDSVANGKGNAPHLRNKETLPQNSHSDVQTDKKKRRSRRRSSTGRRSASMTSKSMGEDSFAWKEDSATLQKALVEQEQELIEMAMQRSLHDSSIAMHRSLHDPSIAMHRSLHDSSIAMHRSLHDSSIAMHRSQHDSRSCSLFSSITNFDASAANMARCSSLHGSGATHDTSVSLFTGATSNRSRRPSRNMNSMVSLEESAPNASFYSSHCSGASHNSTNSFFSNSRSSLPSRPQSTDDVHSIDTSRLEGETEEMRLERLEQQMLDVALERSRHDVSSSH